MLSKKYSKHKVIHTFCLNQTWIKKTNILRTRNIQELLHILNGTGLKAELLIPLTIKGILTSSLNKKGLIIQWSEGVILIKPQSDIQEHYLNVYEINALIKINIQTLISDKLDAFKKNILTKWNNIKSLDIRASIDT